MKQLLTLITALFFLMPVISMADNHDTVIENDSHQLPLGRYFWQVWDATANKYIPSGGYENHYYITDVANADGTVPDSHKAGTNPLTAWATNGSAAKSMEAFLHLPAGNNRLQLSITASGSVTFDFEVRTADDKTRIYSGTKSISASADAQLVEVMPTTALPASAYYRVRINVTSGHGNITKITHWQLTKSSEEKAYLPDYLSSPSVHTNEWKTTNTEAPTGNSYDWAYEEVMIPESSDYNGTYCMSLGVLHGYMGIQVNGNRHDIIFSMWDNGNTDTDKNLPDYLRSGSLDSNGGVAISRFGGEGTGTKAYRAGEYWVPGQWVKFLTNMRPEVVTVQTADGPITYTNTICTAWYKTEGGADNEKNAEAGEDEYDGWHYIASHRLSGANTYFNGWYSFLENFDWHSGNLQRKAYYRNGSLHSLASGKWSHRNVVSCSHTDGGSAAGKRNDYGSGIEIMDDGIPAFYMTTGGLADDEFHSNQQMEYREFEPITQEVMDKLLGRVEKAIKVDEARQAEAKAEATRETLSSEGLTVVNCNNYSTAEGSKDYIVDGDETTYWHTNYGAGVGNSFPYIVDIRLSETIKNSDVEQIELYQSRNNNYRAKKVKVYYSDNNSSWTQIGGEYELPDANRPTITLSSVLTGHNYVRLEVTEKYGGHFVLNEVYFKTARDIEQLKAQARELINKKDGYMGYSSEETAALESVYANGTCTDYDALKQAIVNLASTGKLLKYGKLTETNSISSLKAYTFHNVNSHDALIVSSNAPAIQDESTLNVTDEANNWLLLRSEKWNAHYLYNLSLQKYLCMNDEGQPELTDKLTPVYVGVRTHTENINGKNTTVFDGFTLQFCQGDDNSYLTVTGASASNGMRRAAGSTLGFGPSSSDGVLWNIYDNYGITPTVTSINELLEDVTENGLQPWTRPQFGGTQWTYNKATGNFTAEGKAATANPGRDSYGPVFVFPSGVGTTSYSSNVNTSDKGGFRILGGDGDNVTCYLGQWAGSIEVATGAIAQVTYSNQLKGTEPTSAATVWVDGTLTFGGNRANFDMNDGQNQRWYIGENGKIITSFNTVTKSTKQWDLQIIVADEPLQPGKVLVPQVITREVMTWGADIYSSINSCTVYHKDSDGYYHEETSPQITHTATGLSVTYTAMVNADPEPEDDGTIKMSTPEQKYYYSIRNYNKSGDYAHYKDASSELPLNSTKDLSAIFYFTADESGTTNESQQAVKIHNLLSGDLVMSDWGAWSTNPTYRWYLMDAAQTSEAGDFKIRRGDSGDDYWNHQSTVKRWSADAGSAWWIEPVPTEQFHVVVNGEESATGGITYNGQDYLNDSDITVFFGAGAAMTAKYLPGKVGTVTSYQGTFYVDYEDADPFFSVSTYDAHYYKVCFNNNKEYALSDATNTDGKMVSTTKDNACSWAFVGTISDFVLYSSNGHYVGMIDSNLAPVDNVAQATHFTLVDFGNEVGSLVRTTAQGQGINISGGMKLNTVFIFYGTGDANSKQVFFDATTGERCYPVIPREEYAVTGKTTFTKPNKHTLWYNQPSGNSYANWQEYSLPIGNGELGGSVFGGVKMDKITLNEKSLWDGASVIRNNGPHGEYLKFGNVWVKNLSSAFDEGGVRDYVRYLDIDDAVAGVEFADASGTQYKRTFIASQPDGVVAVKYTAAEGSNKMSLRFSVEPGGQMENRSTTKPVVTYTASGKTGSAAFNGKLELLSYAAQVSVVADNSATVTADYRGITVEGASEITLYYAGGTDFDAWKQNSNFVNGRAAQLPADMATIINKAKAKTWDALLSAHKADYHEYYTRTNFNLKTTGADVTTDKNTKTLVDNYTSNEAFRNTAEGLYLEQLYYNYGRYLLISSNRTKPVPNNLQGLWVDTDSGHAPWNSDIHTNINIQMNYWPAEPNNLGDLHMPLLDHIVSIAESPGAKNQAKTKNTGMPNATNPELGWVINTESNLFGGMSYFKDNYTIANAWYATHLWQHYRYTLDTAFLKKAFPAMWSASLYWVQRLVKNETDNTWECPNEWSPEHGPGSENATAHSQQLVRELFANTLDAITALGADATALMGTDGSQWRTKIQDRYDNLDKGLAIETYRACTVDKTTWGTNLIADGTPILREWKTSDFTAGENGHRHSSHLMALYPFSQTVPGDEYFDAAVNSLKQRSDNSTGWAMGWRVNLWARAQDGDHARKLINNALRHTGGGGIYYNLWDSHAPFQIDGNFGVCAGVSEMLLQSGTGVISLLPALPTAWAEGSMSGLKAVGNFTVDQTWASGKLTRATITSHKGQPLKVKSATLDLATEATVTVNGNPVTPVYNEAGKFFTIDCAEGQIVEIVAKDAESDDVYKELQDKLSEAVTFIYEGLVGYPKEEVIASFAEELFGINLSEEYGGGVTPENYEQMLGYYNTILNSSNVNLPKSGKAYRIKAVHVNADGSIKNAYTLYVNADGQLTASNADATVAAGKSIFVARQTEGNQFLFVNENGDYLNWFDTVDGTKSYDTKGVSYPYNETYHQIVLEHANTSKTGGHAAVDGLTDLQRFGCLQMSGHPKNANSQYQFFCFDNGNSQRFVAGDPGHKYYDDNGRHTYLFKFEEVPDYTVNVTTLKTPKVADGKSYASIYLPYAVEIPEGVKAYKVDADHSTYFHLVEMEDVLPKTTGAILIGGDTKADYTLVPSAASPDIPSDNLLEGVTEATPVSNFAGQTIYILNGGQDSGIGFFPLATTASLTPYKAYFAESTTTASSSRAFKFADEVLTNILDLTTDGSDNDEDVFDLTGRRVQRAQKGLYIINGKKVVK